MFDQDLDQIQDIFMALSFVSPMVYSPNEKYGYPHSKCTSAVSSQIEPCKSNKAARHPMKCDVINDIKLFPSVYHRIYGRKLLTLSSQKLNFKIKCD